MKLDIPILTPDSFGILEKSIVTATLDMPDSVGMTISLWRLKALIAGYRWALDHGMTGVIVEQGIAKGA